MLRGLITLGREKAGPLKISTFASYHWYQAVIERRPFSSIHFLTILKFMLNDNGKGIERFKKKLLKVSRVSPKRRSGKVAQL